MTPKQIQAIRERAEAIRNNLFIRYQASVDNERLPECRKVLQFARDLANETLPALCSEVERLQATYVSQDVAADCIAMLEQAGYGQIGQPNTVHAMVKAATDDLSRLRTERDWQTIDTAPKNGTNFLACSPTSSVFYAHWANGVVDSSDWDDAFGYAQRAATHWMKLPEPPSGTKE